MALTGTDLITVILLAGIFIAIAVYLLYWLYRRSSKDIAFVRTGFGGEKVLLSGGALVLPIIHTVTQVGMSTLKIEVKRNGDKSLITKNRMRIDVIAEFYVRVRPKKESVSLAAQTLGRRTLDPEKLKDLLQGRFIDALSTIAAKMTMDEIQEHRGDYIKAVGNQVSENLGKNGLELETSSLTSLDQTAIEVFNPSNAFDAEGLTQLTEQIEKGKKIRNDIEQETGIQIRIKNLDAEKKALDIEKEREFSRTAQEREIAQQRFEEKAAIEKNRTIKEKEVKTEEIQAEQDIERAKILKDKAIEVERSLLETNHIDAIEELRRYQNESEKDTELKIKEKDQQLEIRILEIQKELSYAKIEQRKLIETKQALEQAEIEKQKAESVREAEIAHIRSSEEVEKSKIEQRRIIGIEEVREKTEIEKESITGKKSVDLKNIERNIEVLEKEKAKLKIQIQTEEARAHAVKAEEQTLTVRENAVSERRKLTDLINAARIAEAEALQLTTIAKAKTDAAESNAAAEEFMSAAARLRYEVDAQGKKFMYEADKNRSNDGRYHELRMKLVDRLDSIIRESVKPMEQIGDIKILQVEGLPGLSGVQTTTPGDENANDLHGPKTGGGNGGGSLADNIVASALRYRAQVPFVDNLLSEIGMTPSEINRIDKLLDQQIPDSLKGSGNKKNEQKSDK